MHALTYRMSDQCILLAHSISMSWFEHFYKLTSFSWPSFFDSMAIGLHADKLIEPHVYVDAIATSAERFADAF